MTENNSSVQSLDEIIKNKSFCIPLYQRNYKWNADIAQKLAEDLLNAYKNRSVKSIGLITLYKNKEGGYDVIDGQQRLITLAILFSLLSETEPILNPIELCFERDDEKKFRKTFYKEYIKKIAEILSELTQIQTKYSDEQIAEILENIKNELNCLV